MKYTLAIIKPGALLRDHAQGIMDQIEAAGFSIDMKITRQMTLEEAKNLYIEHKERSFYDEYCTYMSSGPVVIMKLAKENAVKDFRDLMGSTDPKNAESGTIRERFGISLEENAIHGSDSEKSAERELAFFFGRVAAS